MLRNLVSLLTAVSIIFYLFYSPFPSQADNESIGDYSPHGLTYPKEYVDAFTYYRKAKEEFEQGHLNQALLNCDYSLNFPNHRYPSPAIDVHFLKSRILKKMHKDESAKREFGLGTYLLTITTGQSIYTNRTALEAFKETGFDVSAARPNPENAKHIIDEIETLVNLENALTIEKLESTLHLNFRNQKVDSQGITHCLSGPTSEWAYINYSGGPQSYSIELGADPLFAFITEEMALARFGKTSERELIITHPPRGHELFYPNHHLSLYFELKGSRPLSRVYISWRRTN